MSNIKKEYFPYPGYDHYYQVTENMEKNVPKNKRTKVYSTDQIDAIVKDIITKIDESSSVISKSSSFENLPTPSEEIAGVIYNITNGFVTDDRFIDGIGKYYPAGTNIIVVFNEDSYKFDVLSGEIAPASESKITDIIDDIYRD